MSGAPETGGDHRKERLVVDDSEGGAAGWPLVLPSEEFTMQFFDTLDLHHAEHERLLRDRRADRAARGSGAQSGHRPWTAWRRVRRVR